MSNINSKERTEEGWTETAVGYAERFGWTIVPVHARPKKQTRKSKDSVARQLGNAPLVDIPEGAFSQPEDIREWGKQQPSESPIAVLTGSESNLVALEVGAAAERALSSEKVEDVCRSLPDTRRIEGPDRDYYLFTIPESCPSLPSLKRSDGFILHGENSLIRVPRSPTDSLRRPYSWDITSGDEIAPLPDLLLTFFGIKRGIDDLISHRSEPEDASPSHASDEHAPSAPSSEQHDGSTSENAHGSIHFSSGEELHANQEAGPGTLGIPWLGRGSLTVLTGAPKTAGKSTFTVNLAAHLAAGRSFLEYHLQATPTVILSDLPARRFQSLLQRIGVDREARSRIHVVHPRDATEASWQSVLRQTFEHARQVQAGLVIIDSLDQYVQIKEGINPCTDDRVVHMLTTDAPSNCATLAVRALNPCLSEGLNHAIEHLELLGRAADVVAQMDSGPSDSNRTLRRIQFAGRLDAIPSYALCELVQGRYQRIRRSSQTNGTASGDGAPDTLKKNPDGIPTSEQNSHSDPLSPKENRPSIEHRVAST